MKIDSGLAWIEEPIQEIDQNSESFAMARQSQLTKPPGSLGRLESTAIRLAAMQGVEQPSAEQVHIAIFAADHGVAAEGVSAFPQEVTGAMIANFAHGGAAISVLASAINAELEVIDVGAVTESVDLPTVLNRRIAAGTANFAKEAAMSTEQLSKALTAGGESVESAQQQGAEIYIGGEMGIANTTSATAVAAALLDLDPVELAGPGTGLDSDGISHKVEVIKQSLQLHKNNINNDTGADPLEVLRHVGGFEISALTGAYIRAAQLGVPVIVDGFICSAAALAATKIEPQVASWLMLSHASAEPGHAAIVQELGDTPIIDLGMRLGEGSGAATVVPLIRLACQLHNGMATFAEAGVADGS